MLVLNAGVLASAERATADGIESVFATNHLGQHLLAVQLLPALHKAAAARGTARIVHVSSHTHCQAPPWGVALSREALLAARDSQPVLATYGQSKLAQLLCAQELAARLGAEGANVLVNVGHPGAVDTGIFRQLPLLLGDGALGRMALRLFDSAVRPLFWSAEEGALTVLYLAASAEVRAARTTGRYFHPQAVEQPPCRAHAGNMTLQRAVWALSDELAGLSS